MNVSPVHTRIFNVGESLEDFIFEHVPILTEDSVLIITSKIVALAEGRVVACSSEEEWKKLVVAESDMHVETAHAILTLKDGMLLPNAGIDRSNVGEGVCVLLPKDSYAAASQIRATSMQKYGVKNLGVVITDSRVAPLRAGTTALALGYAGIEGIRDYRGTMDLHGREMKISRTNIVDSLATVAALCMGEGAEQQPLSIITRAPVVFTNIPISSADVLISPDNDLYYPLIAEFTCRASASE
jgi:dihydrofolate synthase / folylpolyglutamate synthase